MNTYTYTFNVNVKCTKDIDAQSREEADELVSRLAKDEYYVFDRLVSDPDARYDTSFDMDSELVRDETDPKKYEYKLHFEFDGGETILADSLEEANEIMNKLLENQRYIFYRQTHGFCVLDRKLVVEKALVGVFDEPDDAGVTENLIRDYVKED